MGRWEKTWNYYHHYGAKALWLKVMKHRQVAFGDYDTWNGRHKMTKAEGDRQYNCLFPFMPKISIAVPTYETPGKYLREMLESVKKQTYSNWELCIADGSESDNVSNIVKEYLEVDDRIVFKALKQNQGIVGNSNAALQMCSGEYIGLLDHDDLLAENALFEVVKAINVDKNVDMLYTDEDKVSSDSKNYFNPHFKTNFNIDLLRSNNYICHFCVIKTDIIKQIGGFQKEYEGAQDYDLILRSVEKARCIVHIPKILYHWRTHSSSTAEDPNSKLYAYVAGKKAISAHLKRCGLSGTVDMLYYYGFYHVKYKLQGNDKVVVVICGQTDSKEVCRCKKNIIRTSGYSNLSFVEVATWSDLNTKDILGDYILFVDYRIRMITPDWMKEILALCQRKETGAVGIKIFDKNDETIYHAGIILGMSGYMFEGLPREVSEPFHRDELQQNVSGISRHFMLISKNYYEEIYKAENGTINELKICDGLNERQKAIVVDLKIQAYINELKRARDKKVIGKNREDFYYNTNFSLQAPGFTLD
nr:glycosyltransferase [Lachnoclostridium phocaeense]